MSIIDHKDEQWINISGAPGYLISNYGRVKSLNYRNMGIQAILKQRQVRGKNSYLKIDIDAHRMRLYVHRIVGTHFILNPENKPFINHKDGNKQNNHVSNLEWCTRSENAIHSFRILKNKHAGHQKGKFGEFHGKARPIKQLTISGDLIKIWGSISDASRQLNIVHSSIVRCASGKRKTSGGFKWAYQ